MSASQTGSFVRRNTGPWPPTTPLDLGRSVPTRPLAFSIPTGMSGLALVLGDIAAIVGGWIILSEGTVVRYVTGGLGLLSTVLGVLALVGENLFNNGTG